MTDLNVRPDKVNGILHWLMVPFCLKAGTMGKLQIKISVLQMWSGPIEVHIDELFAIVGPNTESHYMSHDDSYIQESEEQMLQTYDPSNMFNIFENQLKLRPRQ
jgi:hypothetical protein